MQFPPRLGKEHKYPHIVVLFSLLSEKEMKIVLKGFIFLGHDVDVDNLMHLESEIFQKTRNIYFKNRHPFSPHFGFRRMREVAY